MSYSSPGYPTAPGGATWEQVDDGWIGTYPGGLKVATTQQTATRLGAPFEPEMWNRNRGGYTPFGTGMGGMGGPRGIYQGGGMGGMGGMGGSGIWNNPGGMGGGMGPQSIVQDTSSMGGGMGGNGGMPGMDGMGGGTVTVFGPEGTQTFTPGQGGGWQTQPQPPWNGGGYGGQQGGWQPSPQPPFSSGGGGGDTYPPLAPPPRTSGPASSGNRGSGGATKKKFANPPPIVTKEQLEKDKTSCPICYTDFYDKDAEGKIEYPVRLPCGHVYGQKCIEEWIQETNSCPMCKKEFPIINAAGMLLGNMRNRHTMGSRGGMGGRRDARLSHIRDMRNRYYHTGG